MINPFTGIPTIDKALTEDDKDLLLDDDKWLFDLASKLNIVGHGGGSGGGGGAVDSVNGATGVVVLDSDDIAQGSTNLYSQWEVNTYTADFLQPKNTTHGLVIGQDLHSSVATGFAGISAVFNGEIGGTSSGVNYFANLAYGNGFVPLGGLFVAAHAGGTAAAPTQTLNTNWLGALVFGGYDGSAWQVSGTNHLFSGYYSVATADVSTTIEQKLYMGGLLTPMISFNTLNNAIMFNESQLDSDITFYYDAGASLSQNGADGVWTFAVDPIIPDEAYGAGWNGSLEPPTKNAVYDKIETLSSAGLTQPQVMARISIGF